MTRAAKRDQSAWPRHASNSQITTRQGSLFVEDFGGGNLFAAAQGRVAELVARAAASPDGAPERLEWDDVKKSIKQFNLGAYDLDMAIKPLFDALLSMQRGMKDAEGVKKVISTADYGSPPRRLRDYEVKETMQRAMDLAKKVGLSDLKVGLSESLRHPFKQLVLRSDRLLREFSRDVPSDELVWHRDREDRTVRALEGRGWALQLDGGLPQPIRLGESHHIPAGTWHRLLRRPDATTLRLVIELKKGDRVQHGGKDATVKVPDARGDLVGIDPAGPDDLEMVPEDELEPLSEKDKKGLPGNPGYYVGKKTKRTKSNKEMAREIEKCKKEPRPKSCYDEWTADKTYKEKKKSEAVADAELDALLEAVLSEGELSKKTRETLKKKAEKANMPLGALTAVYRKGLAAWLTGHRQGVPQHAWAMARTNSFIRGGKARSVDKAEWKKVQKHRKK